MFELWIFFHWNLWTLKDWSLTLMLPTVELLWLSNITQKEDFMRQCVEQHWLTLRRLSTCVFIECLDQLNLKSNWKCINLIIPLLRRQWDQSMLDWIGRSFMIDRLTLTYWINLLILILQFCYLILWNWFLFLIDWLIASKWIIDWIVMRLLLQ